MHHQQLVHRLRKNTVCVLCGAGKYNDQWIFQAVKSGVGKFNDLEGQSDEAVACKTAVLANSTIWKLELCWSTWW